MLNIDARIPF